jgi:uncharacterized protein (TIGR02594 family)
MQSHFERLTAMLLVASAIALAGTSTPAHARRHLSQRMLAAETASPWMMEGTQRWSDQAYQSASLAADARATRRHRGREETWQGNSNWAPYQGENAWGAERVGSVSEPVSRRKRRAARLSKGDFGASRGAGNDLVSEARRWIGTNPTGWGSLWCARFMNFVLERTGHHGSGSNLARSFASYGSRVGGPQVGAIAVMGRGGRAAGGSAGGHVGVVSGIDPSGNPIIISGNFGHRVAEAVYPRGRIFAYVVP